MVSGYIVAAMGVGIVFLTDTIQPGSLDKLTKTPLGIAVLLAACVLYAIGLMAIRRITRVET